MPVHTCNATELCVWSEPKTAQNASFPATMCFFCGCQRCSPKFREPDLQKPNFWTHKITSVIIAKFQVQVHDTHNNNNKWRHNVCLCNSDFFDVIAKQRLIDVCEDVVTDFVFTLAYLSGVHKTWQHDHRTARTTAHPNCCRQACMYDYDWSRVAD